MSFCRTIVAAAILEVCFVAATPFKIQRLPLNLA